MPRKAHYRKADIPDYVVTLAQAMRGNMTGEEELVWNRLRKRQIDGLRFRRQHPVGRYIVDFYNAETAIIIEIDGEAHHGREEYDRARDEYLTSRGYRVLRFTNDDVQFRLNDVVERIRCYAHKVRAEA